MRLSPKAELRCAAAFGAVATLCVDALVNGASSGAGKLGAIFSMIEVPPIWAWPVLAVAGTASVAIMRPLTPRGAFVAAVGATALLSLLAPPVSVEGLA